MYDDILGTPASPPPKTHRHTGTPHTGTPAKTPEQQKNYDAIEPCDCADCDKDFDVCCDKDFDVCEDCGQFSNDCDCDDSEWDAWAVYDDPSDSIGFKHRKITHEMDCTQYITKRCIVGNIDTTVFDDDPCDSNCSDCKRDCIS